MNQRLQFVGCEHRVVRPLDLREFVLPTRVDSDVDVNHGFLGTFPSDFGLGVGESSFEVAALEINGKKILFGLHFKHGAQVLLTLEILGGRLK